MLYDSIDDKNLNNSLWILKNVSKIRLFIKLFLIILIAFIYIFLFYNIYITIQSSSQYTKIYNSFLNSNFKNYSFFNSYLKEISPLDLSIKSEGFSHGYSKIYYDFYALISNPNKDYKLSYFEYYFTYNGDQKTPIKKGYINLDSDRYFFVRGIESANADIAGAKLVVQNLRWVMVDKNPKKPSRYIDTRVPYDCEFQKNNVVVSNEKVSIASGNKGSVNVFNFTITNNSLNDYNIVNNKIIFSDVSNIVNYIFEKEAYQLRAGQSKDFKINLPASLQDFGNILILPEVDMCTESSYMPKDIINTGV